MELRLHRDEFAEDFTLGKLYGDDAFLGYTCEDADRHLEVDGEKIYGRTAIPRGRYQIVLTFSNRFKRIMPQLLGVPQFTGVRVHAGNTHANTEGCPLLGAERTADGVRDCKLVNEHLIELLRHAENLGELNWITVE